MPAPLFSVSCTLGNSGIVLGPTGLGWSCLRGFDEAVHIGRVQAAGALTVVSLLPQLYAAHGGASVDATM